MIQVGTVGHITGYAATAYKIVGTWRGYLVAYNLATRTRVNVHPSQFTPTNLEGGTPS